ncbi:putative RNA-directed DNA polymerase, partial [Tanacetum coccineum]
LSLDPFVEIPSSESKVHIEVLSVLWGLVITNSDGLLPLFSRLKGGGNNNNNKNCGLIKVYCLWLVRCRCGSLQKKAHSKNNKSETDKSLLHLVGHDNSLVCGILTNDLDAYDSNCDDISSAKAILMTNLSSYDSDVLSKGDTSRDLWLSLERAYAPHTSSREYTLKTQLLKIEMKADETSSAYLTRAKEYSDALANIGEPVKEKDLVMLVISGLREEYNGLKSTLLARQIPTAFTELHGLLSDHDYMVKKSAPVVSPAQAFAAASTNHPSPANPGSQLETMQSLQQLVAHWLSTSPLINNLHMLLCFLVLKTIEDVAQTTAVDEARHVPSQCPNRDPSTIKSRQQQPSANFADFRSQASSSWLPDTGSNSHVAQDISHFDNHEPYYGEDALHVGNGKGLPILHIGSTRFYSPSKTFSLSNILHVPQITQNLLSVQKFCHDNNVFFEFHSTFFAVKDTSTRITLLTGPSNNGLYSFCPPQIRQVPKVAFTVVRASSTIWHQRLGHPHPQLLQTMLTKYSLPVSNKSLSSFCNSCHIGKSSKLHLSSSNYKSTHILDLLVCDVWGPAPITSSDGHNYFLLCVDDFSRYMWIFPLTHKSDVFNVFKQFITVIERQFNTKLKSVQTDWGGEFRNLSTFFTSLGILHRRSCPHTSEQNGLVERRHRHVVETGLTLLSQSAVPTKFWHFAYDTAVYLINRMPSRNSSNTSPFEHIFKRKPDFSFLKVFGCQCYPHLRPYNKHKMDFRSIPCVFLGYSPSHHGYRCLDPTSNRLYIARHVRFNEQCFPFTIPSPSSSPTPFPSPDPYVSSYPCGLIPSDSILQSPTPPPPTPQTTGAKSPTPPSTTVVPPLDPPSDTAILTQQPDTAVTPPRRVRPPSLRPNPKQRVRYNPYAYHTSSATETEPPTFSVANRDPHWKNAMAEEYAALTRNGTWSLVPPVPTANVVDCKWVYKIKRDPHGAIQRYKARLVAKGFNQQPGIDYHETFSPVVKFTTVRVVLSLAVSKRWPLRQLDVQNAFLHGDLTETVFMRQPPGFVDSHKPDHVCLLHKSLYGLKQAHRAWFHQLSMTLLSFGFTGSKTDPLLFIYSSRGTILYMLVYVDDIILTGNNQTAIDQIIKNLSRTFAVKDMGYLSYFLGIEITPKGSDLHLSQKKYILEILEKAGLSQAKPVKTPITTTANLALGDSPLFEDPVRYRQIVGSLQYATLSRPDIAYAVNKAQQTCSSGAEQESGSILHSYTDSHSPYLNAFSDADWAGCPDDRRSTGGYAIYLGSNLVSWSARKQKTVSRSSTESEYKALADTVAEITWLEALLRELRVPIG